MRTGELDTRGRIPTLLFQGGSNSPAERANAAVSAAAAAAVAADLAGATAGAFMPSPAAASQAMSRSDTIRARAAQFDASRSLTLPANGSLAPTNAVNMGLGRTNSAAAPAQMAGHSRIEEIGHWH